MDELAAMLAELAATEVGPRFMGWPDRWYEGRLVRCPNGHVSSTTLLTEQGRRCLAARCRLPVHLTFPEDEDDPVVAR